MFGDDALGDAALGDALESVRVLAAEDRAGWSAAALSDRVRELVGLAERVDAELLRCVGQWDAAQGWAEDGALSAVSWLGARTGLARRAATRLVRAARLVFGHPRTAEALARGVVSAGAVETIATYVMRREDQYDDHEDMVIAVAGNLGADDLTTAMRAWRSAADDAVDARDPYAAFERRYLQLTDTFGGAHLVGFIDPEGAAWLRQAIAARDTPDPVGGPVPARTAAQRRADALVELARASLAGDSGDAASERGGLATVDLDAVLDLHRLPQLMGHAAAVDDALVSLISGGHAIGAQPVSSATIERLCCDGALTRVVLAGKSQVLDVGRTTRVVTPAQRRALRRRDQRCRFPGCDRPAAWTDAHHLVHWIAGGSTDLDNLVLLCRRHHVLCHEGQWSLTRAPDGTITARPPDRSRPPPGPPVPARDRHALAA